MVTRETKPLGICPACGETVRRQEDVTWVCACNLSPDNAYWEDSPLPEEVLERDQDYSLCCNDHPGWYCTLDLLPLHMACCDAGSY